MLLWSLSGHCWDHYSFSFKYIEKNRRLSIFRALSSQLGFISQGEDRSLLTFFRFFYACTGLRKCYWKEATILTFYFRVLSLAISFSLKEFFFVLLIMIGLACLSIFKSLVLYRILMRPTSCRFLSLLTAPYWTKTVLIVSVQRTSQYFSSGTHDVTNFP